MLFPASGFQAPELCGFSWFLAPRKGENEKDSASAPLETGRYTVNPNDLQSGFQSAEALVPGC